MLLVTFSCRSQSAISTVFLRKNPFVRRYLILSSTGYSTCDRSFLYYIQTNFNLSNCQCTNFKFCLHFIFNHILISQKFYIRLRRVYKGKTLKKSFFFYTSKRSNFLSLNNTTDLISII